MSETVICPACAEPFLAAPRLGETLHCMNCGQAFLYQPTNAPAAQLARARYRDRAADDDDVDRRGDDPLCPGCDRRVGWDVIECPFCGEEFEEAGETSATVASALLGQDRRDSEPSRGGLLMGLAVTALVLTMLGLCTFGVTLLAGLPLATTVWQMASSDLGRMRTGEMDSETRRLTADARNIARLTFGIGMLELLFLVGLVIWRL